MKRNPRARVLLTTLIATLLLFGVQLPPVGAGILNTAPVALDDPVTMSWETPVTQSDASAYDQFGSAVAIDGDTAVVGAGPKDLGAGAAYVYQKVDGVWSETTKLVSSDPGPNQFFGWSVAIEGDTIVVGESRDQDAGSNYGAAHVFTRSGGVWSHAAKITPTVRTLNGEFGCAVAISGDTIAVGSYGYGGYKGGAYVFTGSGASWTQQGPVITGGVSSNQFGNSIDIDKDTLIVGCENDSVGASNGGAAYVYTRSGGVWSSQQQLLSGDIATYDYFGCSVAVAGNTALIGAKADDDGALNWSGSAYAFTRSGTAWTQQAKLNPSDAVAQQTFGASVAFDGREAVIGAPGTNFPSYAGAAYLYEFDGSNWDEAKKLTAEDGGPGAAFGCSAAVDRGSSIVGAYQAMPGFAEGTGESYLFDSYYVVSEDTTLTVPAPGILANDYDLEANPLAVYTTSGPSHGILWQDNDGGFMYKPEPGFAGVDTYRYLANDGYADSNWATVNIMVTPVYDAIPIAGDDRFATSAQAALAGWGDFGAYTVVIATGRNFPDALGGSALAGALYAPLLLVDTTSVPDSVADALTTLGTKEVIILGGYSAVDEVVEQQLTTIMGVGSTVTRIQGADRYETARKVAQEVIDLEGAAYSGNAFVATGLNFPDALAAGPIAAAEKWPIYLVRNDLAVDATTMGAMTTAGVTDVKVLGGTAVVTPTTYSALSTAFGTGSVTRIEGANRYETAAKVASMGVTDAGMSWDGVGVATGKAFPDALSAGATLGLFRAVLVLSAPDALSPETAAVLTENQPHLNDVRYFGGTKAISQAVRDSVAAIVAGP